MGSKNRFYADIMALNQEVTGSCNLVIVKYPDGSTNRFVVDCGLYSEKDYEDFNEELAFDPANLDFALVTHNHIDHTGRLPLLVRKEYSKPIYATEATCKFIPLALNDSLKVLKDLSRRKNKKQLFSEVDVERTTHLLKPCFYENTIRVNEHINVTFFINGHLLGAALILVEIFYPGEQNINLLFTGDYNNKNSFFEVTDLPKWVLKLPLTIVQESTYGDMNSDKIEHCFIDNVLECIEKKGSVVAPVFSLGRAQEILHELKNMQKYFGLSRDIPIYLDGKLALKYTEMYTNEPLGIKKEMLDFKPDNLHFVDRESREDVLDCKESHIILTTSGMGSYGPAQIYIPEYLQRKNALIHFTGYTADETLGRKLKNAADGEIINISGLVVKKRAKVEYTTEYSAHAKADVMIKFLQQFENIKLILINHGEISAKESFSKKVVEEVKSKHVGILGRDYFFRVNPYGLVKTLTTKFG